LQNGRRRRSLAKSAKNAKEEQKNETLELSNPRFFPFLMYFPVFLGALGVLSERIFPS